MNGQKELTPALLKTAIPDWQGKVTMRTLQGDYLYLQSIRCDLLTHDVELYLYTEYERKGWHFCADGEFPKYSNNVLVYLNEGTIAIDHYITNENHWGEYQYKVIAWKELPEKPCRKKK